MKPYQVILLILMLVIFAYIAAFLYVFSHANDFRVGIKKKSDSLSILLIEKSLSLTNIDHFFKNSGVVYAESQDKIMSLIASIKLDHPNYDELVNSISLIKKGEVVIANLSFENQWVLVGNQIGEEKEKLDDLDRNFRAGMALYNADVNAYNYWLSIPGYRLAMYILGFRKKEMLS